MMPIMGHTTLESIRLMANGVEAFIEFCAAGLKPNREACERAVEWSMAMATSLNPIIGYDMAAKIAKQAYAEKKTVRQVCLELGILPEEQLNEVLDPRRMTEPQA